MRLAALFSGGKDSTFAIHAAQRLGHSVDCLVVVRPKSDDSHLLHHPNVEFTRLQSESMRIPLLHSGARGTDPDHEVDLIRDALGRAKADFGIGGIVHGGILSEFQRSRFEAACGGLGLQAVAPLWGVDQARYMWGLLEQGFDYIITSVAADGLDDSWLGRHPTRDDLSDLEGLSQRHGFNMSFEGGEAETFVVDCPLFSEPITIKDARRSWDGYRGRFEILEAELDSHA